MCAASPLNGKRKINEIEIHVKLKALNELERGLPIETIAKELHVSVSTVKGWIKRKDDLRQWETQHQNALPVKRKRLKNPVNSLVDEATWLWFKSRRATGCPLSGPLIRVQAMRFWAVLGGAADFGATEGWLSKWKNRHGIRCLTVTGEKLSADSEGANKYKDKFAEMMDDEKLGPDQVFNADETGLNFRKMPTKTLSAKSESEAAGLKCQKERVTVMACSNASGSCKLPLVLIGKSAKPRAIKNLTNLPVSYKSQKSAWMTSTLFAAWFTDEFVPQVTDFLVQRGLPPKAVLLVDNCAAHPQNLVVGGIRVEYLPPNTTSLIQPMDQGCLQALKLVYRQQLMAFVLDNLNQGMTLAVALKNLNIKDVIFWIADAWQRVSQSTIMKSWKPVIITQF